MKLKWRPNWSDPFKINDNLLDFGAQIEILNHLSPINWGKQPKTAPNVELICLAFPSPMCSSSTTHFLNSLKLLITCLKYFSVQYHRHETIGV